MRTGTKRHIIFLLSLVLGLAGCKSKKNIVQAGQSHIQIVVSPEIYKENQVSLDDLVYHINKVGSVTAHIFPGNVRGVENPETITLEVTTGEQLKKDGQTFSLKVDESKNHITIAGQSRHGYSNGLYYFLEQLGFRWYMPGEAWTIIPDSLEWRNIKAETVTPDFRDRSYFGTGGWGGKKPYDPDDNVKEEFTKWNRRNRISTTYRGNGHTGIAFYRKNKTYLDQHPEFFCNQKPGPNSKLNLEHQGSVDYIIDQKTKNIDWTAYQTIGMDPHDGSGGKDDCLQSPFGTFDNYSDKYFWLANEVAKTIPERANTLVDLYAYNQHARIPSFSLDEKAFPIIAPYAFQNVSPPEQYIRDWSRFQDGKPLGIREYWNITQWSKGLPQFNIYSIPQKMDYWKSNRISSIYIESTWAKGPMGHAWWLFSKYAWDTSQDFDELYEAFLNDCFGAGAEDVKRLYDRWSTNFQQNLEAGLSLSDLEQARSKTTDKDIHRRLDELVAYVVYMDKYYTYTDQRTAANYNDLVHYMEEIHHLGVLQTDALIRRYIPKPTSGIIELKPRRKEDMPTLVTRSRDQIKKYNYDISNYTLRNEELITCQEGNTRYPKYINGKNTYRFYVPTDQSLTFELGTMKEPLDALIMDAERNVIDQKKVTTGQKGELTTEYVVNLKKGFYYLQFGAYYQFSILKFPKDIVFTGSSKKYDNYRLPVLYVYIPADVDAIIYQDGHGPGHNRKGFWRDNTGKRHDPKKIAPKTYRVSVPKDQKGKVWQLIIAHTSFELLNIPNEYSLNCFTIRE